LVLHRGAIREHYLAGPAGLEQSYDLQAAPPGSGPLRIEVTFTGLIPELTASTPDTVMLRDATGSARATYRDLAAFDAEGRVLPAHMVVDGPAVALVIDDAAAAYPVLVDPLIAVLDQKIVASDGMAGDGFGYVVSLSGDTALAVAPSADTGTPDLGAAYVFVRSGGGWGEQAKLIPAPPPGPSTAYDWGASLSGDTAVVSRYRPYFGTAHVFVRAGTTWSEQAMLVSPAAGPYADDDGFGSAVAVEGDTLVVGAPFAGGSPPWAESGAACVYERTGTTWTMTAELDPDPGVYSYSIRFGNAVSISGDTIAVGASLGQLSGGVAYVFVRTGTTWSKQAVLSSSDANVRFLSVSVSGDTLLTAGRPTIYNPGTAYFFQRSGALWAEQAKVVANNVGANDYFGLPVSLSGDLAVIGAVSTTTAGAAYVFARAGATWTQLPKVFPSDSAAGDGFGTGVAVSGEEVIIGAEFGGGKGAAYVYVPRKGQGDPCGTGAECASGFCVDGVCCDTACGGGATDDCQACSTTAGAAQDGTCCPVGDGALCQDGDACTQTDTCQGGLCVGGNPVSCLASDPCHAAGTCDPTTGLCPNPTKPDGSVCSDGNACTQLDMCQAGACVAGAAVQCPVPGPCHDLGACDPASGTCSNPPKTDGAACDDGDACTQADTCQAGACTGGAPVTCAASDECHDPGLCEPTTGTCSNPAKLDGAPCSTGVCSMGACSGSSSSSSSSSSGGGGAGGGASSSSSGGGASSSSSSGGGGAPSSSSGGGGGASSSSSGGGGGASSSSSGGGGSAGGGGQAPSSSSSSSSGSGAVAFGGCGCRASGSEPGRQGLLFALVAGGLVARRRRRVSGSSVACGRARWRSAAST
jgi:MYXO-CTERM domain-containing protein